MKNIFKVVFFLIFIIVFIFILLSFVLFSSFVELKEDFTLYEEQKLIDKSINFYDYTLDNPNVINNPYKISPLSSLVIFNTDDYCSPIVTIYGKYENLVYKYEENKIHYLIIYGLYSDYENKINIKCGNNFKNLTIKTDKIPSDIVHLDSNYDNDLNFISSNYLYAVDRNNEVRWILNSKYKKDVNINILNNNNLIVSSNELYTDNSFTSVMELNLLGKIYKNYYIKNNGDIFVDKNYIYIDGKYKLDRQTGELYKSNIKTLTVGQLNNFNSNFKNKEIVLFNNYKNTKLIDKNILFFNYKKLNDKYNISIKKINNRLVVTGDFDNNESYLILENTFDKKIFKLNENVNYIYHDTLNGKYNIYISINENLYKTSYYIQL